MNIRSLRAVLGLLGLMLCLTLPQFSMTALAESWPVPAQSIQADGAIVIDADSGAVLYGKNQDTPYYPASITKIMTAIVVLESVDNLDDMVSFSQDAVRTNLEPNATIIGASVGDELSVRDCLYSLLLPSANDAANALAEYVAGSNAAFAELMNAKAAQLGCTNTHFTNPSGLNDPEHYTSCADMAKIMAHALQNPVFLQIDQTQYYTHAPLKRYPDAADPHNTVYAHHRMLRRNAAEYYSGAFAGKTGYTSLAGNTLVTAAERNGLRLIAVILNGHQTQYTDTRTLFDFGFSSFSSVKLDDAPGLLPDLSSQLAVDGMSSTDMLLPTPEPGARLSLPNNVPLSSVERQLKYTPDSGDSFASLHFSYEGHALGSARLLWEDSGSGSEQAQQALQNIEPSLFASPEPSPSAQPETLSPQARQTDSGKDEQSTAASTKESAPLHSPLWYDRESGRLRIPPAIRTVLLILSAIAGLALLLLLGYYLIERRTERHRRVRREKLLRHTRDLSASQKARRDMLVYKRSQRRRKK